MSNIKDVAKAANVSVGTVSRAFNGYPDIKEETRQRVLEIAKELNYIPNKAAVDLVRGPKPTIGLFLYQMEERGVFDEFGLRIISGVYNQARKKGFDISFFTIDVMRDQALSYADFLRYHNLVGAIIHGLDCKDPYLKIVEQSKKPTVLIDKTVSSGAMVGTVTTDNFDAAYRVAEKLDQLGHRNILFIAGSKHAEVSTLREDGFYAYFEDLDMDFYTIKKIRCDFNEWQTYGMIHEMFTIEQPYTAIFASSDLMALGAYRALCDLGFEIGKDISIIGFDGVTCMKYTRPTLSTVEQDFYKMGTKSVDLLLEIKNGTVQEQNINIPYAIKMTASCIESKG